MATLTEEWEKASPIDEEWEKATPVSNLEARRMSTEADVLTQTPPSWVPWAKAGMEMTGLVGGGAAGGIAGAGGGYALARQAEKFLPGSPTRTLIKADVEKELGMPLSDVEYQDILKGGPQWEALHRKLGIAPLSPTEKVIATGGEIAGDVRTGVMMEAGGRGLGAVLPKGLPMYARGRTPGAQEVTEIAGREGVRVPVADITQSTAQSAIASSVQKLPQSAYTMQNEAIRATGQFADYVERTLGRLGGKKEALLAGQAAQEGRLAKMAANKTQGSQFYEQAKSLAKDVKVSYDNVNSAIEDVTSSDAYQLLSEGSKKEVDKVISFLENKIRPEVSARTRGSLKLPVDVEAKVLRQAGQESTPTLYAESEGMRKSISDKLFSKNIQGTESYGPIRHLYDALQKDMEVSAKEAGSKVHEAFTHARDFWSKNVFGEEFEKGVLKKVSEASPEKAITLLKNSSLDDISKLKSGMPEANFIQFRQGLLTQLFSKNSQRSPITGETIYNGSQIAKDLFGKSGLGDPKIRALFTKEEAKFLRELATVGERMGASWRIAGNPSGTAHTLYVLHLLSQVGSGVGALAAGEAAREKKGIGAGLATAGAFLSPYVIAKLITSNVGRRYLVSGFPTVERALPRVIPPAIAGTYGLTREEPTKLTPPPPPLPFLSRGETPSMETTRGIIGKEETEKR